MRKRRRSWEKFLAGALIVGLAIIGPKLFSTLAVAAEGTVKVGVISGLTGPMVNVGQEMVHGVEIAVDEVNNSKGINGRKLEIIVEDSEYRPEGGMNAAHKLIDINKVPLILNPGGSGLLLPIGEYAKTKNVIIINTGASSPQLRKLGGTVFSVLLLDDVFGKTMAAWIYEKGFRKAALVNPNNPYGLGVANAASAEFKRLGGEVVESVSYQVNQSDYRPDLQRVADKKPDVIISATFGDDSKLLFKQAIEIGMTVPWYVTYVSDVNVEDPTKAVGRLFGMDMGFDVPTSRKFQQTYVKRFGKAPTTPYAVYAYDGLWVAALTMRKVGTDPAKIRAALPKVAETYDGATGKIVMDADGQRISEPVVKLTITNDGKFVPTQ